MRTIRAALALAAFSLLENVRGVLFVVGAVWLYHGVAGFSRPLANVVAGVLLMAMGAYPYVVKGKR